MGNTIWRAAPISVEKGNTRWRSAPISVEKLLDELRVGVKG